MKPVHLALLVIVLILGIANLLASLGIIGGNGGGSSAGSQWDYKVLSPATMDAIGFTSIAKEDGLKPDEKGNYNFKVEEMQKDQRFYKQNLLPRTLKEVESDGGWEWIGSTSDSHYIFRKSK